MPKSVHLQFAISSSVVANDYIIPPLLPSCTVTKHTVNSSIENLVHNNNPLSSIPTNILPSFSSFIFNNNGCNSLYTLATTPLQGYTTSQCKHLMGNCNNAREAATIISPFVTDNLTSNHASYANSYSNIIIDNNVLQNTRNNLIVHENEIQSIINANIKLLGTWQKQLQAMSSLYSNTKSEPVGRSIISTIPVTTNSSLSVFKTNSGSVLIHPITKVNPNHLTIIQPNALEYSSTLESMPLPSPTPTSNSNPPHPLLQPGPSSEHYPNLQYTNIFSTSVSVINPSNVIHQQHLKIVNSNIAPRIEIVNNNLHQFGNISLHPNLKPLLTFLGIVNPTIVPEDNFQVLNTFTNSPINASSTTTLLDQVLTALSSNPLALLQLQNILLQNAAKIPLQNITNLNDIPNADMDMGPRTSIYLHKTGTDFMIQPNISQKFLIKNSLLPSVSGTLLINQTTNELEMEANEGVRPYVENPNVAILPFSGIKSNTGSCENISFSSSLNNLNALSTNSAQNLKNVGNFTNNNCPHCKKHFKFKSNLHTHIKAVHKRIKPHACEICGKTFSLKQNMKTHVKSIHQTQIPDTLFLNSFDQPFSFNNTNDRPMSKNVTGDLTYYQRNSVTTSPLTNMREIANGEVKFEKNFGVATKFYQDNTAFSVATVAITPTTSTIMTSTYSSLEDQYQNLLLSAAVAQVAIKGDGNVINLTHSKSCEQQSHIYIKPQRFEPDIDTQNNKSPTALQEHLTNTNILAPITPSINNKFATITSKRGEVIGKSNSKHKRSISSIFTSDISYSLGASTTYDISMSNHINVRPGIKHEAKGGTVGRLSTSQARPVGAPRRNPAIDLIACPQCKKTFTLKGNFNVHLRIVHQKQKAFSCPFCSKFFGLKANMLMHIANVHKQETKREYNSGPDSFLDRPHRQLCFTSHNNSSATTIFDSKTLQMHSKSVRRGRPRRPAHQDALSNSLTCHLSEIAPEKTENLMAVTLPGIAPTLLDLNQKACNDTILTTHHQNASKFSRPLTSFSSNLGCTITSFTLNPSLSLHHSSSLSPLGKMQPLYRDDNVLTNSLPCSNRQSRDLNTNLGINHKNSTTSQAYIRNEVLTPSNFVTENTLVDPATAAVVYLKYLRHQKIKDQDVVSQTLCSPYSLSAFSTFSTIPFSDYNSSSIVTALNSYQLSASEHTLLTKSLPRQNSHRNTLYTNFTVSGNYLSSYQEIFVATSALVKTNNNKYTCVNNRLLQNLKIGYKGNNDKALQEFSYNHNRLSPSYIDSINQLTNIYEPGPPHNSFQPGVSHSYSFNNSQFNNIDPYYLRFDRSYFSTGSMTSPNLTPNTAVQLL